MHTKLKTVSLLLFAFLFITLPARAESPYSTLWTRQMGTEGYDIANGVAVDGSGNAYVAGETDGGLDGNPNAGLTDLFLVKYDTDGNKLWTRQMGTSESDIANGVAVDGSGNAFVTGLTYGGLDGNTYPGLAGLFLVKYGTTIISITPISYDFDSVTVGISSPPSVITISNTGTADLHVSGMTLSDSTNYSLNINGGTNPCGSITPTIISGSSCTITVTFSPLSTGQKDASLTINSDDPDTPTTSVSLTGNGVTTSIEITLLSPNGGEIIPSGSTYAIQWAAPSNAVKFNLKYSLNNGKAGSWKRIANKVSGTSYNWTVPAPTHNKKKCFVKVIGYDASGMKVGQDRSDRTFTIEVVKLTSPNGGEILRTDTTHTITWQTNGIIRPVARTEFYYTMNGSLWNILAKLSDNPGSLSWQVPYARSTKCKIKVVLKDSAGITVGSDVSDKVFTIQP